MRMYFFLRAYAGPRDRPVLTLSYPTRRAADLAATRVERVLGDAPGVLRVGPCPAGDEPSVELAALLVARGGIQRGSASGADAELAAALLSAGRHDVLAAPLVRDGQAVGALVS